MFIHSFYLDKHPYKWAICYSYSIIKKWFHLVFGGRERVLVFVLFYFDTYTIMLIEKRVSLLKDDVLFEKKDIKMRLETQGGP